MDLPSKNIQGWDERKFPNFEETTEETKNTPEYCKEVTEAAYSKYVKNKTDVGAGLNSYYDTLRLFGKGKQPQSRYKPSSSGTTSGSNIVMTGIDLGASSSHENNKKGWNNLNWEVISPLPNIKTMIQGHFVDVDYDIKADAIDIDSGAEQESRMYQYLAKATFGRTIFNQIRSQVGLQQEVLDFIPNSKADLEKLKAEGGFKTPYSTEHEKLLLHTENISHWDRSLKKKVLNDAIDLARLFAYVYYDKETCKVKWRYVDPKDVIIQYSKHTDYRDADWGGFLDVMQISELKAIRHLLRNKEGKECDIKDLKDMAVKYSNYSGNPSEIEASKFEQEISDTTHVYDEFKVAVMKFFWIDVVYDKKLEYTTKKGKTRYYPLDDTVKKLSDREKIKTVRRRMTYQCSWIIGTDWVFDFGVMPNQPREPYYKPMLPLVGVKLEEESITERIVPICDMFQIAWLKLQNAIAIAAEDGYAINISQLANIGEKGSKFDPLKVVEFWKAKGLIFYKTPPLGMQTGGTPVPINYVPGGLEQMFTKYLTIMDWCNRQIEILTGFSPVALGSTPPPDQPVGTTQMALSASNKALVVLIDAIRILKELLASVSSPMIQLAIKNDEKSSQAYAEVIGEEGVEILKLAKSIGTRYGIGLVARPTQEEWGSLIELAKSSFGRRSPEVGGINEGQYMWIINQKNAGGNYKEIGMKMDYWIRQDQERIQKEKKELMQMQSQGNIQASQEKGKQDQAAEKLKQQTTVVEINENLKADITLEGVKHRNALQLKRLELSSQPTEKVKE